MPRDVHAEQCCLKMANVKGLVEAIHTVKSPNKNQVSLAGLMSSLANKVYGHPA